MVIDSFKRCVGLQDKDKTKKQLIDKAGDALFVRYEALLAALPDIVMEVDNNKVYTWANQAGFEFFGEDVIGKERSLRTRPSGAANPCYRPLVMASSTRAFR